MPLLWSRFSPKNFVKVTEDSHSIIAEDKHQAYNLPRRYFDNEEDPSGDSDKLRHCYFLTQTLSVCDQHKKITTRTKYKKFCKYDNLSTTVKVYKIDKPVQRHSEREKCIIQGVDKPSGEIRKLGKFHISSNPPSFLSMSVIINEKIQSLKENFSYEDRVELNPATREELKWWWNNLKLNKGKPIQLQNQNIITQPEVAKLGG